MSGVCRSVGLGGGPRAGLGVVGGRRSWSRRGRAVLDVVVKVLVAALVVVEVVGLVSGDVALGAG